MTDDQVSVVVLYNYVGEDVYEKIQRIDPAKLGFEPEYDIRVATVEEEYKAVARALREEGYRARVYNIREDVRRLERVLRRNPPDVVFNLVEHLHDDPALEPHVAALIEVHGIAYTGAPPFALTLCQRKGLTKQVLLANGVPTPKFQLVWEPKGLPARHGLHFPVIVKPAREDASTGVEKESVVYDDAALEARLALVHEDFEPPFLVEEFIEGRELHVAVIGNDPPEVLPPIEFDFSRLPPDHPHIISYDAKWNPLKEIYHQVDTVCPPRLTIRQWELIEDVALKAFEVTGCRDYARLDLRLAPRNKVYVLEVNPNPDLTEGVSLMESAEVAGYEFSEVLSLIVECALDRAVELPTEFAPAPEIDVPPELDQPAGGAPDAPAPIPDPAPDVAREASP